MNLPVTVKAGAGEKIIPAEDIRRAVILIPAAIYLKLAGCGHVPHEESLIRFFTL